MLDATVLGWVSWISFGVTVVGLAFAIWQLLKVREASVAALRATEAVVQVVKRNSSLAEIASALGNIENVKAYVSSGKYEVANIYLDQVRSKVVAVRQTISPGGEQRGEFDQMITHLDKLAQRFSSLEKQDGSGRDHDVIRITLTRISDVFQRYGTALRFDTSSGEE